MGRRPPGSTRTDTLLPDTSLCRSVLELGAQLVICGRRQNVLEETRAEFDADFPGRSRAISCDLRDAAEVDRLVTAVWEEGPLDCLVNNAAGNFIARKIGRAHV